jgi:hypothetical protein
MVTLLWKGNEFKISHQEMIKGMRRKGTGKTWSYGDELIIPIIENTPDEEDLREGMEEVRLLFSPPRERRRDGTSLLLVVSIT